MMQASASKPSADDGAAEQAHARAQCPPFRPSAFRRQLVVDSALWWLFKIIMVVVFCYALFQTEADKQPDAALSLIFIVFVGFWLVYSLISARVAREIPHITELIETDDDEAESMLATALRRKPLQYAVRLLLYHRLAVLRLRHRRYDEVACVCGELLSRQLGAAKSVEAHLLLMMAESRLQMRDHWGAWQALARLHGHRLNLMQALQRLALQTRYEVEAGLDAAALQGLNQKIEMSELMPAGQCGSMHAMLALAAQRSKLADQADWLRRRAELLCAAEQLQPLVGAEPVTA